MQIKFPGLIRDVMKSGNVRWLVRVKGNATTRITLPVGPDHPRFVKYYQAARDGHKSIRPPDPLETADTGTVAWLAGLYIKHLTKAVEQGDASPLTLKERTRFAGILIEAKSTSPRSLGKPYRDLPADIPQQELQRFIDTMSATPGSAKNMLKFIKAMYNWAIPRGHASSNPAAGVVTTYKNQGGAQPWTVQDLQKYRDTHPQGTMAHLTLTLFMFTACRISEAYKLGPANEFRKGGDLWLGWQPTKKGASRVEMPMLPPLVKAIKAQPVAHKDAYLLNGNHAPFASAEVLRNSLKRWCREAEIGSRSSHGIRKAAGHLLSLHGATQYEIMAVHGHANASTSEVYTKGVERQQLAASAVAKLKGMDW